jgi:hypothetical protein
MVPVLKKRFGVPQIRDDDSASATLIHGRVDHHERIRGEIAAAEWYATPWEILRQTPTVAGALKDELTIDEMERRAGVDSDVSAAIRMQAAKRKLFESFANRRAA